MPRPCSACRHLQRPAIDAALAAGTSLRDIAARFTVSTSALCRHRAHIPAQIAQAQQAAVVANAGTLLDQIAMLRDRAQAIADRAEQAGDLRTALLGLREVARTVELLAKIAGEIDDRPQLNVILSHDWLTLRAVILAALEPFVDARQAVAAALVEHEP